MTKKRVMNSWSLRLSFVSGQEKKSAGSSLRFMMVEMNVGRAWSFVAGVNTSARAFWCGATT